MKNLTRLTVTAVLLFGAPFLSVGIAQTTESTPITELKLPDPPQVIPPSPTPAAFGKYGDIPVSLYTGVPDISVPLYTIQVRDITVPISLSYHASGIRVSEEASNVGLGWVLNAGGVISRSINNRDDFTQDVTAYGSAFNNAPPLLKGHVPTHWVQPATATVTYADASTDLGNFVGIDAYDFAPDQFNYAFNGHTGRFVLDRDVAENGDKLITPVFAKNEKILFTRIGTDLTDWKVTTADGMVYYFERFEYYSEFGGNCQVDCGGSLHKSSWYLNKIISPLGEEVRFYYNDAGAEYLRATGDWYEARNDGTFNTCIDGDGNPYTCTASPSVLPTLKSRYYTSLQLSRIEWVNGAINFQAATRDDIERDKRITGYTITRAGEVTPFQEVIFDQSYFASVYNTTPSDVDRSSGARGIKRLKLNRVIKRGLPISPKNQNEEYSFTYYEDHALPSKTSLARDHWGYFNNRNSNASLIPTYTSLEDATESVTARLGIMGHERDPNPEYATAFSLKTITYPTGGYSTFTYSGNDYEVSNTSSQTDNPETYELPIAVSFTGQYGGTSTADLDFINEYEALIDSVPTSSKVHVHATFVMPKNQGCTMAGPTNFTLWRGQTLLTTVTSGDLSDRLICDAGAGTLTYDNDLPFGPGMYRWEATIANSSDPSRQITHLGAIFTVIIDARKQPNSSSPNIRYAQGGGLRIQQIESYEPERDMKVNVKRYNYHYTTHDPVTNALIEHSSGRRMVQPVYSYFTISGQRTTSGGNPNTQYLQCLECQNLIRTSSSIYPLTNQDGITFAYDKVQEITGEFGATGEIGHTDYWFENLEDDVHPYIWNFFDHPIPIHPPAYPSTPNRLNGMLKLKRIYNSQGKVVQETAYTNSVLGGSKQILGLDRLVWPYDNRILSDPNVVNDPLFSPVLNLNMLLYHSVSSSFPYVSKIVETSFLNDESTGQVKTTDFAYQNPSHLQLTTKTETQSDLSRIVTNYKYAQDYFPFSTATPASTTIGKMATEKFMHSLPIETTITKIVPPATNQLLLSRDITVFSELNGSILPTDRLVYVNASVADVNSISDYNPASTTQPFNPSYYSKFYSLGYTSDHNLNFIQKKSDVPVSYLWGYNNTLIAAEIKGAAPSEVYYTSFEDTGIPLVNTNGINLAKSGTKVSPGSSFTFPEGYPTDATSTLMSYFFWDGSVWNSSGVIPFSATINKPGMLLDEIRAFPKGAQMSTFSWDPLVGQTSTSDANARTTYFEYDDQRRLKLIRDNDRKLVKSWKYIYRRK